MTRSIKHVLFFHSQTSWPRKVELRRTKRSYGRPCRSARRCNLSTRLRWSRPGREIVVTSDIWHELNITELKRLWRIMDDDVPINSRFNEWFWIMIIPGVLQWVQWCNPGGFAGNTHQGGSQDKKGSIHWLMPLLSSGLFEYLRCSGQVPAGIRQEASTKTPLSLWLRASDFCTKQQQQSAGVLQEKGPDILDSPWFTWWRHWYFWFQSPWCCSHPAQKERMGHLVPVT